MCHGVPKLETLHLAGNELSGRLPPVWSQCKELKSLDLSRNRFNGELPRDMGNLTMLQQLYIGDTNLEGKVPRSLFNISSLRDLVFYESKLRGSIPQNMCHKLPQLEILGLTYIQFEGSIPRSIGNCTLLKMLYLGSNSFRGSIPNEIGGLHKLEDLVLSSNLLSGQIPLEVYNISTLKKLYLGANSFSGFLPPDMGSNLPNLEKLLLTRNELVGTIPSSLFKACKLTHLYLSMNKFSGVIPNTVGNLTSLIILDVEFNNLRGLIPTTINGLQALQFLNLANNGLQGSIVDEICHIRSLSELYLHSNVLSGSVPKCLGNVTSLRKLYLASNKLSSQIPSSLWNLKDILELNLSSNALSGTLAVDVEKLKAVILLDLSRNQISGIIPTSIGGLETLQNLSLAHNGLRGSIPESLGHLISIVFLDLSHNYLSGMIPKSLESVAYLKYMNLSCNRLQGEIPNGGPFTNLIAESFMMNAALCGKSQLQVPPCRNGVRKKTTKELFLLKYLLPVILLTILVVSFIILPRYKRKRVAGHQTEWSLPTLGAPRRISYYELQKATNGFHHSNLLGRGGFDSVFKGVLSNGMMVAVKVFILDTEATLKTFDTECDAMCNLRHRNLIKIISSCLNVDFKSLVMQVMPNGSLENWVHSDNFCLNFLQRLNIMIDVSLALEYLHHGSSKSVVHCDVKPSNILLDQDMAAHLSDFGTAKLLDEGQFEKLTKILTTLGYIAPEYGFEGIVSIKADVYSYGIVLMETFTRKKPTDDMFVQGLTLKTWVSESISHSMLQMVDSKLLEGDEQHIGKILSSISSIMKLGLNCSADSPEERLTMKDVATLLNKIKINFLQILREN